MMGNEYFIIIYIYIHIYIYILVVKVESFKSITRREDIKMYAIKAMRPFLLFCSPAVVHTSYLDCVM